MGKRILIAVVVLAALGGILSIFEDEEPPDEAAAELTTTTTIADTTTTTQPPTAEQVLADAFDGFDAEVRDLDQTSGLSVTMYKGLVFGGTDEVVRGLGSAFIAIAESGMDTSGGVDVRWETDGTDQFGNELDDVIVAHVEIDGETMQQINWSAEQYTLSFDVLPDLWRIRLQNSELDLGSV